MRKSLGLKTRIRRKYQKSNDSRGTAPSGPITTHEVPRRQSTAPSTVSELPKGLSSTEIADYAQELFVHDYIAVSVLRGEMMPKNDEDTKLHHSYEVCALICDIILAVGEFILMSCRLSLEFYLSKK